jgi:hypothetical protein
MQVHATTKTVQDNNMCSLDFYARIHNNACMGYAYYYSPVVMQYAPSGMSLLRLRTHTAYTRSITCDN